MKKYKRQEPNRILTMVISYAYVLIGSCIMALAFNLFLLPNKIASGGISGISIILDAVFGWEPAIFQAAVNVPLFFLALLTLGLAFGAKSLLGTFALPFFVYLSRNIEPLTTEPLLGALFGGIGIGLGLGMVFRGNGSTGGVAILAAILHKYTGISLGACVALIDGITVTTSAFVFNVEQALYALIGLFVTSKTIDIVQVGFGRSKMALIITDREPEVRKGVLEKIDRGVTRISAQGGYTDDERPVLMCVVEQSEFTKLKQLVKSIDSSAFVIVMDASEVLGEGFKRE
ncbi:YitT family protein [Bacillus tianshenii]|nr:YitT family protein [Bacillus tianshenii]